MAVFLNITSIGCAATDDGFLVSNSGWTENTDSGAYGSGAFATQRDVSPFSARPGATQPTRGYLNDTVPGSKNHNARITLFRPGASLATDQYLYVGARMTPAGNDWLGAFYAADIGGTATGHVGLVKCVNGTLTTIMAAVGSVGVPSSGGTATLEIRVTGSAPSISVSAWYNGSQVGTTQTVADAELDTVGRVGFFNRLAGAGSGTGMHMSAFYAEDDTAGATLTGNITPDDAAPTGTLASVPPSTLTGNITTDAAAPTGTLGAVPGTITTSVWKNDAGDPQPLLTVPLMTFLRRSDGVQVLTLANQVTSSSPTAPVIAVTNAALVPGVFYMLASWTADGSLYGIEQYQAA